jgi:hypothetical protein
MGFKDSRPGTIRFDNADGLLTMHIALDYLDGLYYCQNNVYTVDPNPHPKTTSDQPVAPTVLHVALSTPPNSLRRPLQYTLVSKSKHLESELWLLCLGSPGVSQLNVLPGNTICLPAEFDYHPFCFIDFKAQAQTRKQATQCSAVRTPDRRQRFYMDFGFMRTSAANYSQASKSKDCVVYSYDGFTSYLLILDEALQFIWVFLTLSKDPPLDLVSEFLHQHGHEDGGCVRTDQGGKLA